MLESNAWQGHFCPQVSFAFFVQSSLTIIINFPPKGLITRIGVLEIYLLQGLFYIVIPHPPRPRCQVVDDHFIIHSCHLSLCL